MWRIEEQPAETLVMLLQESPSCYMVSGLEGEIYWANSAFLRWSNYTTIAELRKVGWVKLSVDNADLQADKEATEQMRAGQIREYVVEKQYIPKNGKPEWGLLSVQRYPMVGEFSFALCHWTPLKNGTAQAFALAMDRCEMMSKEMRAISQAVLTLTNTTEEQRWIESTVVLAMKHPKISLGILVIMLSVFGMNNILELLQRSGLILLPTVPVVQPVQQPQHGETSPSPTPETIVSQLNRM